VSFVVKFSAVAKKNLQIDHWGYGHPESNRAAQQ